MTKDNMHRRATDISVVWRWVAAAMFSIVMMLVGSMIGGTIGHVRESALNTKLDKHTSTIGHPVMVQKVDDLENSIIQAHIRINNTLERMMAKEEAQSRVLREIEQKVTESRK